MRKRHKFRLPHHWRQTKNMAAAVDEETLRFLELIHRRNINAILETATKHHHVTTSPALFFCSDICHLTLKKKKEMCFLPLNHDESTHAFAGQQQMETHKCSFILLANFFFFGKSVAMCVTFLLNTKVNNDKMKRGRFYFAAGDMPQSVAHT